MTLAVTALIAGATFAPEVPMIIPQPVSVVRHEGQFVADERTSIVAAKDSWQSARMLQAFLSPATGFPFRIVERGGDNAIHLSLEPRVHGAEGYAIEVSAKRVVIKASAQAGLFYGSQTLRQLFPAAIFRKALVRDVEWAVPCVSIQDSPRFSWRGAHLDVARHFMPKEFVLKYLDLMAVHKLNTFHWHLTDDQGWRLEIKKYPKLTEIGGWRKDDMLVYDPPTFSGRPHGGSYTQDDVREVVAYAAERHIAVVPEIEMPGHAQAAIAAYPELGNTGRQLEVSTKWGVMDHVFNVEDSTISFLQDVLSEVMELFPGQFIHIGGDECPKKEWKESPKVQARIKDLGLKDEHELQSWFIRQMDAFLDSHGRRLIGWSEILEGGLAPGAALMVWLGDDGAMEAVNSGHDVVMAQTSHTYFDYYQSKDRTKEPHAIGGFLPLEQVYSYEPILPRMRAEQAKHVLGAQFQLWTEYIRDPKHAEYMAFPRACAVAEVVWTPKGSRDFGDFSARLPFHLDRLAALDVNFRRLQSGD